MFEFRTSNEVDLDFALTEYSDNPHLSKERRIFLRKEISRLQQGITNDFTLAAGRELIDLTLPVTTPPAKKRYRKNELLNEEWNKQVDDSDEDSDSQETCPWSDESAAQIHSASRQTSFENGFSFSNEVCRECSAKLVTEESSKGREFSTCPYSALRDENGVKIRDEKGKVKYDKSHTFYWTGRK